MIAALLILLAAAQPLVCFETPEGELTCIYPSSQTCETDTECEAQE